MEKFKLNSVSFTPNTQTYICNDETALTEYLSNLKIQNISGVYTFEKDKKHSFTISYKTPDDFITISLFSNFIEVQPRISDFDYYYLPDGVDFDKLHELITVNSSANR